MIRCVKCNIRILRYNYITINKETYCLHCAYIESVKNQKNFRKLLTNKN